MTALTPNKYIAIEGVIGVGKTTLARLLQPRYNASILLEVVEDNPFLPRFYQDRERYAFQTQIFFLLSRYHQQYQAVPDALSKGTLISDYTFAKDELFAWLNLKDDELAMYGRVHAALGEKIPSPDLIVFLRADHDVLMRRIALRDRPFERDIDPDYIREVAAAYDAWLSRLSDVPVLTIDTNQLDYLSRPDELSYVVDLIEEAVTKNGAVAPAAATRLDGIQHGQVATFQQLHRQMDSSNGLEADMFFHYMLLAEEVGEVAANLIRIWTERKRETAAGLSDAEARELAITRNRAVMRDELADLLAHILRIANDMGIDLEQAYLDKMRLSLGPQTAVETNHPGS
jgi:deoxyguanosine kinase